MPAETADYNTATADDVAAEQLASVCCISVELHGGRWGHTLADREGAMLGFGWL